MAACSRWVEQRHAVLVTEILFQRIGFVGNSVGISVERTSKFYRHDQMLSTQTR